MKHCRSDDLAVKLVERRPELIENLMAARREVVDASGLGSPGLGGPKPAALRHPRQDRIQRAGTQPIAMVVQFLEHPLSVHTASVSRMVQNVNLPEAEQELTGNGIAHAFAC